MAQQTQISISAPTVDNAMPHFPSLAAKRSHEQIEPVAETAAPVLKKVKTNDDNDAHEVVGNGDVKMMDKEESQGAKEIQEMEHGAALAVLDDGVKESDAASGRSAWCMELGEY